LISTLIESGADYVITAKEGKDFSDWQKLTDYFCSSKASSAGGYNIVEREVVVDSSLGIHGHPSIYLIHFADSIREKGLKIDISIMNLRTGQGL